MKGGMGWNASCKVKKSYKECSHQEQTLMILPSIQS